MAKFKTANEISDALAAPLGELIGAVGRGVAEAQRAMDQATIEMTKELYAEENRSTMSGLRELGYQPTWYKIPEVEAQISITLNLSGESSQTSGPQIAGEGTSNDSKRKVQIYATPTDATYTNKFDYQMQGSSFVKFKIVPVPPSPQAAEMRVTPNLVGLTFQQARGVLESQQISFQLAEQGMSPVEQSIVKATLPTAGEILASGKGVTLEF